MVAVLDVGCPKSRTLTAGVGLAGGGTLAADRTFTAAIPSIQDFRLSLVTADPVPTADQTGKTTIYMTPYKGRMIALYDGAAWALYSTNEISLALGTLTSGLPYDVFAYNNVGTITLEFLAWTNGTTRATALVRQDGVWCKTGALTRRYVGTFYTTSTTATEDSEAKRFLFNADNRVARSIRAIETTDSWTYSTAAWRQANNSTANQVAAIVGLAEEMVAIDVRGFALDATAVEVSVGVGVDSTTANSARLMGVGIDPTVLYWTAVTAVYRGYVAVGYHYFAWLEYGKASGTVNWAGDNGRGDQDGGAGAGFWQGGISGELRA